MELSLQALWELMQNGGRPPPMPPEGLTGLADAGTVPAQNGRPARVIMNTASPQAAPEPSYDPMTGARIGADTSLKRPNWFMEPDLYGYQTGKVDLPYGAVQNEAGGAYYPDTGEELSMVRRPGVLPVTMTPDGPTFPVMPKMADLAGYLVGGAVPVKGGEMVLGAGPIRRKPPPMGHNGPPADMQMPAPPPAQYLRIGDWHPSETSRNYAKGSTEAGVSVYDIDPKTGHPIPPPEGEWSLQDMQSRLKGDEPKYIVEGRHVGTGHEGEALLKELKKVREWSQDSPLPPPQDMSLSGLPAAIEQGAIVDPVQAARKAIQDRYGAIGSHPDEQALTINNILDEAYAGPVKSRARNVSEIGGDLHAAGSDALRKLGVEEGKIDFKTATPHQDEIVSRAVASEIMAALKRGGKTAADWYTKAVQEAMGHAEAIHPELANDPLQKMGFTAALAITSQGEKVRSNVRLSEVAYDHFKKTGRFPTNINAKAGAAMNENFGKLNELLDTIGPEATMKFLHTEYTVKELQQLGHEVGGENMGAKVYGSSIFGPKIGQGFFQNLNGNYNPVTMDLWFMRGMGRLTGTLSGKPDLTKQTQRFASALEKEGIPVPSTIEEMSKLADDMVLTHERDFRTNRASYDSGDKTRSELSYAAERLQAGLSGLNETPTGGGHRQWLRDRVQRAKELLKEHGHDLTAADMQAIWWYPEKDLYGKLGGLPSEGINTDYATVYRELRGKHGKP